MSGVKTTDVKVGLTFDISQRSVRIISGFKKTALLLVLRSFQIVIAIFWLRKPGLIVNALKSYRQLVRGFFGKRGVPKIIYHEGLFYFDMYIVGWPSKAFLNYYKLELHRLTGDIQYKNSLNNVLMAITTKCPLQCEHCYEWDLLNSREILSADDLIEIAGKFADNGLSQIHFGGGEPMMRYEDILQIMNKLNNEKINYWLATSGYGLTTDRALELKKHGLTGVSVSLDHYNPVEHNLFRNRHQSYDWAKDAIKNARNAGLLTTLSICVSSDFLEEGHMPAYMELAMLWDVAFVQWLDPKPVGRYAGRDVSLNSRQKHILAEMAESYNRDILLSNYPKVIYHEAYIENYGCFGAGKRMVYVDPAGNIQACPFCRSNGSSVLQNDLGSLIMNLKTRGCKVQ
ncbi:MAG: radical SAM protein [Cyclobacteriaceae bacterium]|nr:radical SAM protein [Cyclobacteriaceae bacterium]